MQVDEIPEGRAQQYEALVDTSAFLIDGGTQWVAIRKLSPKARFPVVVHVPDVGPSKCQLSEVLEIRPKGGHA